MNIRTFVYIPHSRRAAFKALGWICSSLRGPHGLYSVLGEWPFDTAPVFPEGGSGGMRIVVDTSEKSIELEAATLRSYGDYVEMIEAIVTQIALLWPDEHRAYIESGDDDDPQHDAPDSEPSDVKLLGLEAEGLPMFLASHSNASVAAQLGISTKDAGNIKCRLRKKGLLL
jgi:hypothetical protein